MTETTDDQIFPNTPARPPFDPELAPVLEVVRQGFPPFSAETLPLIRQQSADGFPGMEPVDLTVGGAVRVEERQVPGPDGAPDITLLILSPTVDGPPRPAIYHTHGGGMVIGNRRLGVEGFLPNVADGTAVVVSVEYRLAPEHPGPDVSPYAAPARAEDLTGLPRTYIDTGSAETFRDETLAYARRLSEAGVSVDLHMWGGGFHGFDMMAGHAAVSRASVATRDEFIRRALEG